MIDEAVVLAFAAAAARLWGLLRVQPLWRAALGGAWEVAAPLLALVLAPLMLADAQRVQAGLWALVFAEFALGTLVGLVVALPGHALLGSQAVVAERLRVPAPAWQATTAALALALALTLELQRPLLLALREGFAVWPIGSLTTVAGWEELVVALELLASQFPMLASQLLWLAFALATPVLLVVVVVELALAFTEAGQTSFEPANPLRALLVFSGALVALGASWAAYPEAWARAFVPLAVG